MAGKTGRPQTKRRSTSANVRHISSPVRRPSVSSKEELDTLVQKLDHVYGDIERRRLKAERPRPRKVCD